MICEFAVIYLLAKDILHTRVGKRIALLVHSFASAVDKKLEEAKSEIRT